MNKKKTSLHKKYPFLQKLRRNNVFDGNLAFYQAKNSFFSFFGI